jgi:hypothetical protein
MLAYEIYSFDKTNGYELIGVLPERRKDPRRITRDSVLKWGTMLLDGSGQRSSIFFKPVTINRLTGRLVWVNLPLHRYRKMARHPVG